MTFLVSTLAAAQASALAQARAPERSLPRFPRAAEGAPSAGKEAKQEHVGAWQQVFSGISSGDPAFLGLFQFPGGLPSSAFAIRVESIGHDPLLLGDAPRMDGCMSTAKRV